jgi:hypothetical protein
MKKLLAFSCWTLIFGLLLLGLDQFFLRIPASVSPHREAQTFYLDFRTRLLALTAGEKSGAPASPVPGQKPSGAAPKTPAAAQAPAPAMEAPALRYVYVDQGGDLHFADSLQEIPAPYRADARPLSR